MLGFGMLIPDFQLRAEALGAPGIQIGAILALMFVVQLLTSPLWGHASDKVGRKQIFLVCTGLSVVSMVIYGAATTVAWITVSRFVAGLGGANMAVAQATVSDLTGTEERTPALGRLGAAMSTGLVLGPALGGLVTASFGSATLGYLAAAFSATGLLLVAVAVRPSSAGVSPGEPKENRSGLLREHPGVASLVALAGVAWFALSCLEGTFGRLIKHNLGYGSREFGIVFSYESAVALAVQALALRWLVARFRERTLLWSSFLLQGVGLSLTPLAPHLGGLLVLSSLYASGTGVANPTISGMASKAVPSERQGELFGIMQSARSVGFVGGPVLGGWLFDMHPAWPYWMAGAVCAAAALATAFGPWAAPKPSQAG